MPGAYQSINVGLHFLSVITGRYAAVAAGRGRRAYDSKVPKAVVRRISEIGW
jgi:hypothetical protein